MDLLERFNSKYQKEKITPIAEKKELADFETVSKRILPAVDKAIVELNEADREEYEEHAPIMECDGGLWSNIVLNDMLDDAAGPESLDTDTPKSPGDDNATIAAAPTIQDLQEKAFMLACCYLWLVDKSMDMRKKVLFLTPNPFAQLVEMRLLDAVPAKANWQFWNRLHEESLYRFEKFEHYQVALQKVMCENNYQWREKMLTKWNEQE